MDNTNHPAPGSFEAEFHNRIENIIQRGKAVGMTVTMLCKETDIARATPDRWRKCAPKTIKLVDQFEAKVSAAEKAAGK